MGAAACAPCCSVNRAQGPAVAVDHMLQGKNLIARGQMRVEHNKEVGGFDATYKLETGRSSVLHASSTGSVVQGVHKKSKVIYAIKTMRNSCLRPGGGWMVEVQKLKALDSPNICKLFETWECKKYVYIVFEYCKGGDLTTLGKCTGITEAVVSVLVRQMVGATVHLHDHEIAHGDIKCQDWLFVEPITKDMSVVQMQLKMIDFGLTDRHCVRKGSEFQKQKAQKASVRRQKLKDQQALFCKAPEQLERDGVFTKGSDVWALGVLAFFMICGHAPFPHPEGQGSSDKIGKAQYSFEPAPMWKVVTDEAKIFIKQSLVAKPNSRPQASELLASEWMVLAKEVFDDAYDERSRSPRPVSQKVERRGVHKLSILDAPLPSAEMLVNSFKRMNQMNTLERAAVSVAAHRMKEERVGVLRQAFQKMDINGDGVLSAFELVEGLKASGLPTDELLSTLGKVDTDGSGCIEYSEFVAATFEFQRSMQDASVTSMFRMFDADGSGRVTKAEIAKALGRNGSDFKDVFVDVDLKTLIKDLDKDGDGEIDIDEFRAYLTRCQGRDPERSPRSPRNPRAR